MFLFCSHKRLKNQKDGSRKVEKKRKKKYLFKFISAFEFK